MTTSFTIMKVKKRMTVGCTVMKVKEELTLVLPMSECCIFCQSVLLFMLSLTSVVVSYLILHLLVECKTPSSQNFPTNLILLLFSLLFRLNVKPVPSGEHV